MEIIIGLIVVGLALWWFAFRKKPEVTQSSPIAPYKVETPAPEAPKCSCGRSPTGLCVGLHKLTPDEWSVHSDNPNKVSAAPVVSEPQVVKTKTATKPKVAKTTKTAKPKAKKATKAKPQA